MPPESLQIQAAAELELRRRKRTRGELTPQVTPDTAQPLPFINDPTPGAGRSGVPPSPFRAGVPGPPGLAGLVSQGFSSLGFDPTTDEQVAAQGLPGEGGLARGLGTTGQVLGNIVKGGIKGPVKFGAGLVDALAQSLGTASIDPILEQAEGLVKFIPEQLEIVGTALGAKRSDPKGRITGINQRTGLATREPITPSEEEIGAARQQLREHPEGPIFAALLGRGVSKGVAKRAKPKPIELVRPEQKVVTEFFETQPEKPFVVTPEKITQKSPLATEAPKIESKKVPEVRLKVTEGESFVKGEIVDNQTLLITSAFVPEGLRRQGIFTRLFKQIAEKAKAENPNVINIEGNVISEAAIKARKKFPSTKELLPKEESPLLRTKIEDVLKPKTAVTPLETPKTADVPRETIEATKRIESIQKETKSPNIQNLKPEAFSDLGDFVVLGADKLATARKGTFKRGEKPPPADFNKFSKDMVSDFGENIRPHIEQIFDESVRVKETVSKELLTKNSPRPTQSVVNEIKKTFTEYVDRTPATFKSSGKIDLKRRARKEGAEIQESEPTIDGQKISEFKDIGNITANFNTFPRIMRRVLGKERADRMFVDNFDNAKGATARMSLRLLEDLESTISNSPKRGGFGIREGARLSKAVQEFGEQKITYDKLVKKFGKKSADNVVNATAWFREKYDLLLDEVNATMEAVYPGRPDKLIAKRQDYFRHFQELSEGVKAIPALLETPSEISPSLVGISEVTRPFMKFLSFAQRRVGSKTRVDAVGGFKNYILQAAYAKHITPQIKNLRNYATELRAASQKHVDQTGATPNLNRYIEYIDEFANHLSGKTEAADRLFIKKVPGGRKSLRVVDWVSRRAAQNAILGNVASLYAMPANLVNAAGKLKLDLARGAKKTIVDIFDKDAPLRKSDFWKERDLQESFNRFNTGWMRRPVRNSSRFAGWFISVADKVGGYPIWNGAYRRGIELGVKDPIKFADNMARDLLAGRGVGDKPLAFTAKSTKLLLVFQLEVTNAWYVLKDLVSEKQFAGLAVAMVAAWSYNRLAEEIRGNKVVFDPIDGILDAVDTFNDADPDKGIGVKALEAGGRLVGEVLSNVPLGQVGAALYPEHGIGDLPTRKELFGAEDPTRFGTGVLATKAFSDPLFSLLPPFGGQQIKKTIGGVQVNIEGEVRSKSGKRVLFQVPSDTETQVRNVLFGKWSTPAAREYFDKRDKRKTDLSTKRLKRPTLKKK